MINGSEIIVAIKALIDADTAIADLLGVKSDSANDSKVILSGLLPAAAMFPLILLPDPQIDFLPQAAAFAVSQFDIQIWTALNAAGAEDFGTLYSIVLAAVNLIEGKQITTTTSKTTSIRLATSQSCQIIQEVKACLKSLRFEGRTFPL